MSVIFENIVIVKLQTKNILGINFYWAQQKEHSFFTVALHLVVKPTLSPSVICLSITIGQNQLFKFIFAETACKGVLNETILKFKICHALFTIHIPEKNFPLLMLLIFTRLNMFHTVFIHKMCVLQFCNTFLQFYYSKWQINVSSLYCKRFLVWVGKRLLSLLFLRPVNVTYLFLQIGIQAL